MELGYDGMKAAEKKLGAKVAVKYIENVKFGDMEQVLVALAGKNELVIGIGGQTQASVFKVAPRFPKVKFAIIGGNADPKKPANVSGYDVRQAEIAFVAGAAAAMLSKTGGVSYVGGLEIPAIKNAGIEFGNGARYINPNIKYFESYTGDFDDVAKAKEATLAAIAQGADIHYHILNLGLRGMEQAAREKGTHIIGSYTDRCGTDPLYVAYSITGVGFQVEYAMEQRRRRHVEAGVQAVRPGHGPAGLRHDHLQGHARAEGQARGDQEGPAVGQDQGPRRLILGRGGDAMDQPAQAPLLSLDDLGKRFGSLQALDGVSLGVAGRHGAVPAGRERRRQVDALQPDLRRLRAERRPHDVRRQARGRRPARPSRWSRASPWCTSISAWCRA